MTIQDFKNLTSQGTVLLDGAMGTNLYQMGMPHGCCTESWALKHPDKVEGLQRKYVEAGAQILYAPTFGANRAMLSRFGLEDQLASMNRELLDITRRAAGDQALVAGDLSPTGMILEMYGGDAPAEEMFDVYREQAEVLYRAGCDLFVVETMMSVMDAVIAVEAVKSVCACPVICTLSVRADGTAYYGGNIFEGGPQLEEAGAAAYGINCCDGPAGIESIIARVSSCVHIPVVAKPNAGFPKKKVMGRVIYSFSPEDFARNMKTVIHAGASIVGGCCGTEPEYIRALKNILEQRALEK